LGRSEILSPPLLLFVVGIVVGIVVALGNLVFCFLIFVSNLLPVLFLFVVVA